MVRVVVERVQVKPHGGGEHDRVLRDDADPRAQGVEGHACDVKPVDQDLPAGQLLHAKQRVHQTALSGTM